MRNTEQYDLIISRASNYLAASTAEQNKNKKKNCAVYETFQLCAVIEALTGVDQADVLSDIVAYRQ
jgi:hypothetical protein